MLVRDYTVVPAHPAVAGQAASVTCPPPAPPPAPDSPPSSGNPPPIIGTQLCLVVRGVKMCFPV